MDNTEIPVYSQQEQGTYNGHYESTCYQPLLLFNSGATVWLRNCDPAAYTALRTGEELLCRRSGGNRNRGRKLCFEPMLPSPSRHRKSVG
jgi:hypothetical protein